MTPVRTARLVAFGVVVPVAIVMVFAMTLLLVEGARQFGVWGVFGLVFLVMYPVLAVLRRRRYVGPKWWLRDK